jgi:hypothetical protein
MAKKTGDAKSKSAGKMKIQAGPSGGMHNFQGVGKQKAGVSGVSGSGASNQYGKLDTGGSGKMHKFKGVGAAKKA